MASVTIDLDGSPAAPPEPADIVARLPRRVRLSREAVEHLATLTGVPLPWPDAPEQTRTARALEPDAPRPGPDEAADPVAELREARLLTALGDVHPEAADAMAVLGAPEVLLDLDLSVRRSDAVAGFAQLHAWHRLQGGHVTTLATAGGRLELGWLGVDLWQLELARAVSVTGPRTTARAPQPVIDLPHELLLGAGEALRLRREDVLGELVARHTGSVLAGRSDRPLGRAATDEQVRLLHTSVLGRMRTLVAGVGTRGARKAGWVSWLLFPDGWRALEPHVRDHEPRVLVHPVEPLRLGVEVARLVTAVTA